MIKNTTIQNRTKHPRLSSEHIIPTHHVDSQDVTKFLTKLDRIHQSKEEIIFSVGCHLVRGNQNPHLQTFLAAQDVKLVDVPEIPLGAFDLLGSVYQFLNSKKENLEKGSFYTGRTIAAEFLSDLDFSDGQVIFDPSCGSGAFLFNSNAPANQIFGVDFDPIAVMIAKFNYFIKFPDAGAPQIYCGDFFEWLSQNEDLKFDYIIGNPPYGANLSLDHLKDSVVVSGESFSYFLESSFKLLADGGKLRFLVPESLLNVKRHTDIRKFILEKTNLRRIKRFAGKFAGVMSDVYMIELDKAQSSELVSFEDVEITEIPTQVFSQFRNQIFVNLSKTDVEIIERVEELKRFDLADSDFGLGVVTGDNKTKLFSVKQDGMEHVYTGKEVTKYQLLAPQNYLFFRREELQQVAPDHIYRAPEKLVYKTISKRLNVALDASQSLTTNSANIVIPKIPGYTMATVMALLNSNLYSYLYLKLNGGVNKISREGLSNLPFPELTVVQISELNNHVKYAIKNGCDEHLQAYINESVYGLCPAQSEHISTLVA